jgi:hypothetical protein
MIALGRRGRPLAGGGERNRVLNKYTARKRKLGIQNKSRGSRLDERAVRIILINGINFGRARMNFASGPASSCLEFTIMEACWERGGCWRRSGVCVPTGLHNVAHVTTRTCRICTVRTNATLNYWERWTRTGIGARAQEQRSLNHWAALPLDYNFSVKSARGKTIQQGCYLGEQTQNDLWHTLWFYCELFLRLGLRVECRKWKFNLFFAALVPFLELFL